MVVQLGAHLDHVNHRHAFGDTNDQLRAGVGGFEYRVGGKRGADVYYGRIGVGFANGFRHRVEYRHRVLELLSALARRDAGYDVGTVLDHLPGVKGTIASGDSLHHQPGIFVY